MNDLKKDFPLLMQDEISYLDSASTTQKPQQVLDAIQHAYTSYNANPGRGMYTLAEEATEQYESARNTVAQFIGAKPNEIIFTANATAGINLIAQGWARQHLKSGDEILLTELEHHSNLLPWQRVVKETGAQLKFIPIHHNDCPEIIGATVAHKGATASASMLTAKLMRIHCFIISLHPYDIYALAN